MQTQQLQRRLKPRHIAMIALGGTIGSGLFLGSGNAVSIAGPGGAIVAFTAIGLMVYFLMTSLGEMSALMPVTGAFCEYSSRFVDPAFGFAQSYNYWFSFASAAAVDFSGAAIVMQYWFPHVPMIYWSLLFFVGVFLINALAVGIYGETEYWFAGIKVLTVVIFIVIGVLLTFGVIGHHEVDFRNWTVGDAPFHQGWKGLILVLLVAGFSFQGAEIFGVTAGEAKNPRKSIPNAVKTIFWRIVLFYILSIFIIGCLVPYTDPSLIRATEQQVHFSPFVLVFHQAGFAYATSGMNFIILLALLSAASSSLYTASRMLWHTAKEGHAPRLLAKTTRRGVPLSALILTAVFAAASFLTPVFGVGKVFTWLLSVSSLAGFLTWLGIAISHYRFRRAYVLQGYNLSDLPYRAKFFPFGPLIALALCLLIIVGQQAASGATVNWGSIVGTYIGLPIFLALYLGYKYRYRTKLVALRDCRFPQADF